MLGELTFYFTSHIEEFTFVLSVEFTSEKQIFGASSAVCHSLTPHVYRSRCHSRGFTGVTYSVSPLVVFVVLLSVIKASLRFYQFFVRWESFADVSLKRLGE